MWYETERLKLKYPAKELSEDLKKYLLENEKFLASWEPERDKNYYNQENLKRIINSQIIEIEEKKGLYLYIYLKDTNELIGTIGISGIIYGPFLSCFLGYKLSEKYINNGYMTEALKKTVEVCFNDLKLHRIEANVVPGNIRSKKVLEKLGFIKEGTSRKYLKINGIWEDHEHYVLLNDEIE